VSIDWPALRAAATAAARKAYAPYSGLRVGAAGQTSDGRVVTGCNVENVSYGLTLCAECGLVSALHATSPGQTAEVTQTAETAENAGTTLLAVAVVAGDGEPLLPCGRCRQLLLEAGGGDLLVDTAGGPVTLTTLLPAAFTDTDLTTRREATSHEAADHEAASGEAASHEAASGEEHVRPA
jgi:cytidine deaminase